jgi:hypothetical protein
MRLLDRALLRSAGDTEPGFVAQDVDAAGSAEHLAHRAGYRTIGSSRGVLRRRWSCWTTSPVSA